MADTLLVTQRYLLNLQKVKIKLTALIEVMIRLNIKREVKI